MINATITTVKYFIITGFPGLQPEHYSLVSALLFLLFLAILLGNVLILAIIMYSDTLWKPKYWILFHLAIADLLFGFVTLPKVIAVYWWKAEVSPFAACFTQMYFVHSLGAVHSLILFMMSLDCFIAIWFPFKYPVVVTNRTIIIACNLCWIFTFIRIMGIVLHALTLPYCNLNIISQCYCDHISVTQLACGENVEYVQRVAFGNSMVTLLVPLSFIIFSYSSIIVAVLKISQNDRRHKVLSTCLPQFMVTCLYYMPRCFDYITNYLGFELSSEARTVITTMYNLMPAMLDPIIYCLKTKDIKETLIKKFRIVKIHVLK